MSESLILFDHEFSEQHDGVAMGSPLGPTLANVFLCYHQKIWPHNCPCEFKSVIFRRYVYDTLLLFCSKLHHIDKFRNSLNRQHKNIRFNSKIENENSISFLDIKKVGTITNSRLHFTTKQHLTEFLPTLEASSLSHINTTCRLPNYTGHSNSAQILNFFIRKLTG